jgi:hypothetical protein
MFRSPYSVYCLCVNVCCTAATGCYIISYKLLGYAVAQSVEALRYKPERRGFDSLPDTLWSWGRLSPYQEYFLGCKGGRRVGLTTLSRSCADYLEIWEPQTLATMRACPGVWRACFTFTCKLLFHIFLLMIIWGSPESLKTRQLTYLILFNCTPSRILCLRSV